MNTVNTFNNAKQKSSKIWIQLQDNPKNYRVITGDRPTGPLHIGHYFGTLMNRVYLQGLGVESFIVIADYQVLTDRNSDKKILDYVKEIVLDYLAVGLDPINSKTTIFTHSSVPELNQLLLPFLSLVSISELKRNPTIKDEIMAAELNSVNAAMIAYPVHQAADILFCNGNLVPVGKDQLPHLELARKIARRFNERYGMIFSEPNPLLSEFPMILGLDGKQKMSKSRKNAIFLNSTEDETVKLIKKAKTDDKHMITYDPENRPEVANLLRLLSLCSNNPSPEKIANEIGDRGSGYLKTLLIDNLNAYFLPFRKKRIELSRDPSFLFQILKKGNEIARQEAIKTLEKVKKKMKMHYLTI